MLSGRAVGRTREWMVFRPSSAIKADESEALGNVIRIGVVDAEIDVYPFLVCSRLSYLRSL